MLLIHHSKHLKRAQLFWIYWYSISLSSSRPLLKLILAWLSQLFSGSSSCPLCCGMSHHIPWPKSTVKVRWWNHQEWENSTQESMRHLKRTWSLINQSCSCSKLKQNTGLVSVVDSTSLPTLCFRFQTLQFSHHLMALYASRTFYILLFGEKL